MYSDDSSELTGIESDDDYQGSAQKLAKNVRKQDGYRIKNALKPPRATTYTAAALHDQIINADIDLEPEYQRDVVWPDTKQIGLIDSIFRNFYIPPVIFATKISDDGTEAKTCIDGKQRLTSIRKFMDGIIPHKDPSTGEKLWYKDDPVPASKSRPRKILPDKLKRAFANKQIVCVEYQDITGNDEREIFQRVQLGMALTPAEKLQVISTPRAAFIREVQYKFLKDENGLGGEALEWDRSRGSDFRCLAQAIYCINTYGPTMKSAGSIVRLEKWLSVSEPFPPSLQDKVHDTFRVFSELVQDPQLSQSFKKPSKVSPIEFVLISLFVAVHKDALSRAQLAATIAKMRDDVRDSHFDIRMNDRVAKTMLDFIKNVRVAGVGESSTKSTGAKRKRSNSEDDDADYKDASGSGSNTKPKPKAKKSSPSTSATPAPPKAPASTSKVAAASAAALSIQKPISVLGRPSSPPSVRKPTPVPTPASTPTVPAAPTPTYSGPSSDRMAALRAAKSTVAAAATSSSQRPRSLPTPPPQPRAVQLHSQAQASSLSSTPRALAQLPSPSAGKPPSPSQQQQQRPPHLPQPPRLLPTGPKSLQLVDTALMATLMRGGQQQSQPHTPVQPRQPAYPPHPLQPPRVPSSKSMASLASTSSSTQDPRSHVQRHPSGLASNPRGHQR